MVLKLGSVQVSDLVFHNLLQEAVFPFPSFNQNTFTANTFGFHSLVA